MKIALRVVVLLTFGLPMLASEAARQCAGEGKPCEEYRRPQSYLRASLPEVPGSTLKEGDYTTYEGCRSGKVDPAYKAELGGSTVQVVTGLGDSDWWVWFQVGEKYLVLMLSQPRTTNSETSILYQDPSLYPKLTTTFDYIAGSLAPRGSIYIRRRSAGVINTRRWPSQAG